MSDTPYAVDPDTRVAALQSALEQYAVRFKEQAARIEQLEAAQERLWCKACGTVTRSQTCDCDRWYNEMSREPNFVNYADAMQEEAREQAQRIEQLEAALREAASFMKAMGLHPEGDAALAALAPEQSK